MTASSKDEVLDSFSVVPSDPDWDQWYKQERRALLDRVPSGFLDLEHIGSTALPGLDAKPIIDAMAAVARIDHCESIVLSLEEYGYILIETGMRNRLFFRRRSAEGRIFHLHLVEACTWDSRKENIASLTDGTSTEEEAPQREDERTSRRLLTSNTSSGTTPLQTQSR